MKLHILRPSHRKCSRRKGLQALTKTKTQIFLQLPVQNLYLELELKTKDSLLLVKKKKKKMVEVSYRQRKKKFNDLSHFVKRPKYLLSLPQINIHSICISHIWEQNRFFFPSCTLVYCILKKKSFCPLYHIHCSWFGEEFMAVVIQMCQTLCKSVIIFCCRNSQSCNNK